MKTYLSLIKMRFINGLQYRAAALAGIATQFAFGFMFITMYIAFYRTNPDAFPMEISQVVSYIWIQQAFLALFMSWYFDNEIFETIVNGEISYDLARPMDLFNKWFCQCIARRLSMAVLRCFPILFVGFLLPEPYKLVLPPDFGQLLLFLISSVLALSVIVASSMFIYISTFYTMSPLGLRIIYAALSDFLAGHIIPLPFFPEGFRQIAQVLPFAAMQNMPLRIYSGNIVGIDAINGVIFQVCWFIVLFVLGKLFMNSTLKKVVVQGG